MDRKKSAPQRTEPGNTPRRAGPLPALGPHFPQPWPVPETRFPEDLPAFDQQFATEDACLEYLVAQRWPQGFHCPRCTFDRGWTNLRHHIECASCHYQTSLTAGTILHGTRKPLRLWFRAMWWICTQKTGISAAGLKRILGLRSMQTAWVWLQKLRQGMVRVEREPLEGQIQFDDADLGEGGPGWKGARLAVAVELDDRDGEFGRIRLLDITDRSSDALIGFIRSEASREARIMVDAWPGHQILAKSGFQITVIQDTNSSSHPLPWVRRVISLVRRWLLGTHQGRVSRRHLQGYLDEFVFRYNRRKSPHVGQLFQRLVSQGACVPAHSYRMLTTPDIVSRPGSLGHD